MKKNINSKSQFVGWLHKWCDKRISLGIVIEKRQYQTDKLWEIIQNIDARRFVLAACPDAGKTLIAIIYLEWCLYCDLKFRALVLTHGTDVLRTQFREEAEYYKADFLKGNCVVIDLPQSLRDKILDRFDLIIVDEAHQFYFAPMVQSIIKQINPSRELLLTGTPSEFIEFNKVADKDVMYYISYIDVHMLWNLGHCQDALIEIATSSAVETESYNVDGDLKENVVIEDTINKSMTEMMTLIMERLKSRWRTNPKWHKLKSLVTDKVILKKHVDKTMIVCRNLSEAASINRFLLSYGYGEENIMQSTSDIKDSNNMNEFKRNKDIIFLIVVYRGILGFNFSELCNIIDLTRSHNVNRIFQLYCRLIRKSKEGKEKFYYKVVPENYLNYFSNFMAAMLHLSHERFMKQFNGKNFLDMYIVPRKHPNEPVRHRDKKNGQHIPTVRTLPELGLNYIFKLEPLLHKGGTALDSKAFTTLRRVMVSLDLLSKESLKKEDDDRKDILRTKTDDELYSDMTDLIQNLE